MIISFLFDVLNILPVEKEVISTKRCGKVSVAISFSVAQR